MAIKGEIVLYKGKTPAVVMEILDATHIDLQVIGGTYIAGTADFTAISAPEKGPRGLWVWTTGTILPSATERQALVDWCHTNNLKRVYLWLRPDFPYSQYEALFSLDPDIEWYALEGDASYVDNHSRIKNLVQFARDFNQQQAMKKSKLKFAGFQMDIEPYTLPGWEDPNTQPVIIKKWIETLRLFGYEVNRARNMISGAALPFWCDTVYLDGKDLFNEALGCIDEIVLMSYRENMADLLSITQNKLDMADKLRRKICLAVETTQVDPEWLTFYEEGRDAMESVITDVYTNVKNFSFGGIIVHDYNGHRNLTQGPRV